MNRDHATGECGTLAKTVIAVSAAAALLAGVAVRTAHPQPEVTTTTAIVTPSTASHDDADTGDASR